jgi:hypothetical protein
VFIAECERGSPHYHEAAMRGNRARILLARDDVAGAEAEAMRSVELSRAIDEPQTLIPSLVVAAGVLVALGRPDDARELAEEVLDFYRRGSVMYSFSAALAFERLGLRDEFRAVLAEQPPSLTVREALAFLDGDYVGAAELAEGEGAVTLEAQVRLAAARAFAEAGRRAEADEQLAKALGFFRSVGATRYIREGEALLAATA